MKNTINLFLQFKIINMRKSKDLFDKFSKLLEQGITSYRDISNEIINICRSKRDDFIFKMKITGKEETDILKKRVEVLEKKLDILSKKKNLKR